MLKSKTAKLIDEIDFQLGLANNAEDVHRAVKQAVDFGKATNPYLFRLSLIAIVVIFLVIMFTQMENTALALFITALTLAGLFSWASLVLKERKTLITTSKKAYVLDAICDRGMTISLPPRLDEIGYEFGELRQGNYKRELVIWAEGELPMPESPIRYQFFRLSFTDKVEKKDSRGRTYTRYYHYERDGLIFPLDSVEALHIKSTDITPAYYHPYRSESISFNSKFLVYDLDQRTAAKFLKPSVLLAIESLSKHYKDINIEISEKGRLCISFPAETIIGQPTFDLSKPALFYRELQYHNKTSGLEKVVECYKELVRHSDNNFTDRKAKDRKSEDRDALEIRS